jgi:hypothetical protein
VPHPKISRWRQQGVIPGPGEQLGVTNVPGADAVRAGTIGRIGHPALLDGLAGAAPLNCSIFLTDIAGYGDLRRDDHDRRFIRDALYRILRDAFDHSGVPWHRCLHEDRGDGTLTIVPPTVSTELLVDPMITLLAAALNRYNRRAGDTVRMQLRVALTIGPVSVDPQGLIGRSLIDAARMLDAPPLKAALAETGADLGFIVSDHVYQTIVQHVRSATVDTAAFRQTPIHVKESRLNAWMLLTDAAHPRGRT